MRWRIDLAYDGTNFAGWAAQPGLRTVQGELETWLPRVLRSPDPIPVTVAGRTDAGVHATGQVAHFDLAGDDTTGADGVAEVATRRLRRVLADDIVIAAVTESPAGFDARFSALWRRYSYRVWDEEACPDPRQRGYTAATRGTLDLDTLNAAAGELIGLRDFAPFCKPREGATTIRTLLDAHAERLADGTVDITVRADAFCHSMVRSLVGALVAVATGQRDATWLDRVAAHPVRHNEVLVMPAKGLTLVEVAYPEPDQLAERAQAARSVRLMPEES